jgi:hypothetical protein
MNRRNFFAAAAVVSGGALLSFLTGTTPPLATAVHDIEVDWFRCVSPRDGGGPYHFTAKYRFLCADGTSGPWITIDRVQDQPDLELAPNILIGVAA